MKLKLPGSQVQKHSTQHQTLAHFPSTADAPPPRHHPSSLLRRVPTRSKAQLVNLTCRSFLLPPEQPTTVIPRSSCLNLSSTPIFPYILFTNSLHSILSCTINFACSKVDHLLFKAFLTPSIHTLFGLPLPTYTLFAVHSCPNHPRAHLFTLPDRSTCTLHLTFLFSGIQTSHLCLIQHNINLLPIILALTSLTTPSTHTLNNYRLSSL